MSTMNPRDDQWLRDVLDNAVADVEPREALHEIRARTRPMTPLRPGRTWMWGAGGAMLATAATVAVIAAIGGSTSPSADDPGLATSPRPMGSPPRRMSRQRPRPRTAPLPRVTTRPAPQRLRSVRRRRRSCRCTTSAR